MALLDRWNHFWSKRIPLRARFQRIYTNGGFGGTSESASGVGSTLDATLNVRAGLAALLHELNVRFLLDAPCGDFHWMQHVELRGIEYVGLDIVPEVVDEVRQRYGGDGRTFRCVDLRRGALPAADLVLCRDCLVHLSNRDALEVLRNLLSSGAEWYLLTTFPTLEDNDDMVSGTGWRALNLALAPFGLGPPRRLLAELEQDPAGNAKALGLWARADVIRALRAAAT